MRVVASLLFLLALPSCGAVSRLAPDLEIPLGETQKVTQAVALMPRFDVNQDMVIDAAEFDTFLTWFAMEMARTFAPLPPAQVPVP